MDAAATFRVLRRPHVPYGMIAAGLFFMVQFALFTYLRPFLETITHANGSMLSALLLILGFAGLLGTWLIGFVVRSSPLQRIDRVALSMAVIATGLVTFGTSLPTTTALLALWGLIGTAAPVGWWTWLSRVLPDEAEAGGGLMVAVVQLAITAGASSGGLLFDSHGYVTTFLFAALILSLSAAVTVLSLLRRRANGKQIPQ